MYCFNEKLSLERSMDKTEKNFELTQSYALKKSIQSGVPMLNPIPKENKIRYNSSIKRTKSPTKVIDS